MRNIIIKVAVIVLLLCHSTVSYSQEKPKSKKAKKHSFKKEMVHFGSSVTEKPTVNSNLALPATVANWDTDGNTLGSNDGSEFLGSSNNYDVFFKRNGSLAGRISIYNTSFGLNSFNTTASGIATMNTAFGVNNLTSVTDGNQNVAVGTNCLTLNTDGIENIAIGNGALSHNISGAANIAIGDASLSQNNGSFNIALGRVSLGNNQSGTNNIALGDLALLHNVSGSYNAALGVWALNESTGTNNCGLGPRAGQFLASGDNNIFIGTNSGPSASSSFSNRLYIGNWIFGENNNIGIGVQHPAARLHTDGALRFDGLLPSTNNTALMIDPLNGNVSMRDLSSFLSPTSSTEWSLAGNTLTTGSEYIGTNSNHDLLFKRNGLFAGRISSNDNTYFGLNSGLAGSGGNTVFGSDQLTLNTNGFNNVVVGHDNLKLNDSGYGNVVLGNNNMNNNGLGNYNIAIGNGDVLNLNTQGHHNIAIGAENLELNNVGSHNVSIGNDTMSGNTSGDLNTVVGAGSLLYNQTGHRNVALGSGAGNNLVSGNDNLFLGSNTPPNFSANASDQINIGNAIYGYQKRIGINVLNPTAQFHTNGSLKFQGLSPSSDNTALVIDPLTGSVSTRDLSSFLNTSSTTDWSLSGNALTTGTEFLGTTNNFDLVFRRNGTQAGRIWSSVTLNTSYGLNSLPSSSTGANNTAIGSNNLVNNGIGGANVALGSNNLQANQSGNSNIAIGSNSLSSNISGSFNTAIGTNTLNVNTSSENTAVGNGAMTNNTGGQFNAAFGSASLFSNQTGNNNVSFGRYSLFSSKGSNNVGIGNEAGSTLTAGNNNIFIGASSTPNISTTASNQLNIGNWIYGYNGDIGIGVAQPTAKFHTNGLLRFQGLQPASETNFLTVDSYGYVTTRDLSTFMTPPSNTNIYTSDGTLKDFRTVSLDKYTLTFLDDAHDKNHIIIHPERFSAKNDAFLSIKLIRNEFFQRPNLVGWGMSNIGHPKSGITLTQGLWDGEKKEDERGGNWLQSSIVDVGDIRDNGRGEARNEVKGEIGAIRQPVAPENRSTTFPLLLNPLGGYVGVGLTNPTAQLHTINSVRFENLDNPDKEPEWLLGTDSNGNVYEYSPGMFGNASDTDDWKLNGNAGTDPGIHFIGTTDGKDFVVRTANTEKFRFTDSPSGRIIVNAQGGSNYNQNFYLGGGNSLLIPSTSIWGPIAANTAIGYGTLNNNTSGNANTALGSNALVANLTGNSNIGVGVNALLSNKTGTQNVAIGVNALSNAGPTSAQVNLANTALGNQSFQALTTGQSNVGIGSWSGFNQTGGNNNILIGSVDTPSYVLSSTNTTASNQLNIGNWITGNGGNIGIGLVSVAAGNVLPTAKLHTYGALRFDGLLPTTTSNNVLVVDGSGNVNTRISSSLPVTNSLTLSGNTLTSTINGGTPSTVNLSTILPAVNNIYTNDGTLGTNRIAAMNGKTLRFNFGTSPTSPSASEVVINPALNTSANLSVAAVRSDVPNLAGNGMSRLDRKNTATPPASSFLTTGYNSDYFWTQASNPGTPSPIAANYMINPNGGKVAIGTTNITLDSDCPDCDNYRLFVAQGIRTEKVRVDLASVRGWADYVFDNDYKLMPLKELETYIGANKHLPNIPKAEEVAKTGIDLGEMNAKLLEKIEELTLHTIEINKKNETLEKNAEEQKALIQSLAERLEKLENKAKQ